MTNWQHCKHCGAVLHYEIEKENQICPKCWEDYKDEYLELDADLLEDDKL